MPLATITPDDARSGRPAALPLIAHRMRAGISPTHTWPDGALHNLRSTLTCAVVNTSAVAAPVCQASFSERDFRNALGQFATGVTVVTTADAQGNPVGMTVSSFNSVSLDPALVLWSIARSSGSFAAFAQSSHYAIHVLASHHKALAFQFAQRGIAHLGAPCLGVGEEEAFVAAEAIDHRRRLATQRFLVRHVGRLQAGDTVRVLPGEAFPADGEIVAGSTHADEALLTGESTPVLRHVGDAVADPFALVREQRLRAALVEAF